MSEAEKAIPFFGVDLWELICETVKQLEPDAVYSEWNDRWFKAYKELNGRLRKEELDEASIKGVYALFYLGRLELSDLMKKGDQWEVANRGFLPWSLKKVRSELFDEGVMALIALEVLEKNAKKGQSGGVLAEIEDAVMGWFSENGIPDVTRYHEMLRLVAQMHSAGMLRKQPWKPRVQFVMSIGFLHSYLGTVAFFVGSYCVYLWLIWMAGLWSDAVLIRHIIDIIIGSILIVLAVFGVRLTVGGYIEEFDVFDQDVLQQVRPYGSLGRVVEEEKDERWKDARKGMRSLFSSETAYEKFKEEIRVILYPPKLRHSEYPWLIAGLCCGVGFLWLFSYFSGPALFQYNGMFVPPWTWAMPWVMVPLTLLFFVFGFSVFRLMYGYVCVFRVIGFSRPGLRVWNYIYYLRRSPQSENLSELLEPHEKQKFMTYSDFYHTIVQIGRRVFYFSLIIIIIMVGAALHQIIYDALMGIGFVNLTSWIFAAIVLLGSVVVFLVPQLIFHFSLQETQEALLQCWQAAYDKRSRTFVAYLTETANEQAVSGEVLKEFRANLSTLRTIIQDTQMESTWAFGRGMAFGTTAISLIPTAAALIQSLLVR